ncbi:FBD-associated F-box protein At5g18780 [Linum grandiflorum]
MNNQHCHQQGAMSNNISQRDRPDRLSYLPDPVLHHILSFLDTKHAVQTSVLSRPWRHLWRHVPLITLRRDSSEKTSEKDFKTFVDKLLSHEVDLNVNKIALLDNVPAYDSMEQYSTMLETVLDYAVSQDAQHLVMTSKVERLYLKIRIFCPELLTLELAFPHCSLEISAEKLRSFTLVCGLQHLQSSRLSFPSLDHADVCINLGTCRPVLGLITLFRDLHRVKSLTLRFGNIQSLDEVLDCLVEQPCLFERLENVYVKSDSVNPQLIKFLEGSSTTKPTIHIL